VSALTKGAGHFCPRIGLGNLNSRQHLRQKLFRLIDGVRSDTHGSRAYASLSAYFVVSAVSRIAYLSQLRDLQCRPHACKAKTVWFRSTYVTGKYPPLSRVLHLRAFIGTVAAIRPGSRSTRGAWACVPVARKFACVIPQSPTAALNSTMPRPAGHNIEANLMQEISNGAQGRTPKIRKQAHREIVMYDAFINAPHQMVWNVTRASRLRPG